tara:strand:- start:3996 stop:4229 length:234 start_codon:yes stop_codon:yes gene_type:complete
MNRKTRRKNNSVIRKIKGYMNGKKAGLHSVQMMHDDWCLFFNGKGDCNCNPIFQSISYADNPKEFIDYERNKINEKK